MTCSEAYKNYRDYYRNNQWTGEDVQNFLRRNWIDYEEFDFDEFKQKLLSSDLFDQRWSNGCTRQLSLDERFTVWENLPDKDVLDFPIGPLSEVQQHEILDQIGIAKRVIIN